MKSIKLFVLAGIVALTVGCASNSTKEVQTVTVGASVNESIEILDRHGTLNESVCARTSISVECELLRIDPNNPVHQFMRFNLYNKNDVTTIEVTRWLLDTSKKNDKQIKMLDVTQDQLDSIGNYIEKHRNRVN